jgi:hypothetical protein
MNKIIKENLNLFAFLFLVAIVITILTAITFLAKSKYSFSPICGNDLCEPGETKKTCLSDCALPSYSNKIKAIFDSGSNPSTSFTNETLIDYYLSLGIDTIVSHSNGELRLSYYNFSKYSDTVMPPVLANYSKFSYSKGFRYFPGIAWDFNASKPYYYIAEGNFEKTVLMNGAELDEVSPWSEDYWNNYTELLVRLARYGKSEGNNIDGVWFDFELYTINGGAYINDSWGFENSTWRGYLQSINVTDPEAINTPYNQRIWWLAAYSNPDNYYVYLHNLMFTRARNMKNKVMAVNPDFIIGAYPTPLSYSQRRYLDDIYSGWSYPDSPTIVWATDSYGGGGVNNIPKTVNESALMYNRYYNLTTTYNKSMYGYYVGGLLIGVPWYSSNRFTERVFPMANATSGYWIWQSGVITPKCEDLVGGPPRPYERRLPTNCANDASDPGCCINNDKLSDTTWISKCCPYYSQTVGELWRAINATNHQLNPQENNSILPPPGDDDDETADDDEQTVVGYCTPNWTCPSWTQCINNTQYCSWTDLNNCNNLTNQPNAARTCDSGETIHLDNNDEEPEDLLTTNLAQIFIYSLIGVIGTLIIITTVILLKVGRNKYE